MNNFTDKTLQYLKNFKDIDKEYSLEKSKDNRYIIKINKEGKNIYLGSKYNVQRDIDTFLDDLEDITSKSIIIVFGLASGEHIKEILKKLEKDNKILIIEPDINVLNKFIEVEYSNDIIEDDRVILHLYKKEEIESLFNTIIDNMNVKKYIKIKVFSKYDKIYQKPLLETFYVLKKVMENSLMNNITTKYFSETFTKAFINNLKHIVKSTPINYFQNEFKDKPSIVVSAGPSLEKNIHKLKSVQGKFIIITGARSLGSLIKNGITPDFICMIDPKEFNCKFIEDYSEYEIPLVFYENTSYKAMDLYRGPKVLFSGNPLTSVMLEYDVDGLITGGSVAHTCTSFAVYLGCNPITFIGQDFAYTEEKLHSDSSVFQEKNIIDNEIDTIEVKDIFGNLVKTDRILNIYRLNMEGIINNYNDKIFINSTEGGANMEGTIVQSLDRTIEQYGKEDIEKEKIKNILKHHPMVVKEKILKYLEESEEILDKICKKAEKALNYSNDMYLAFAKNININISKINRKLDEIDNYIKENRERIILINSLLFETIENVLCNTEYMLNSKDSERENSIKVAEKSMTLYKGIRDKIKEFMPILKDGIESLKGEI
ncbi:motility associated factor glycosyltransferase family protein [Clostridium sp. JNZ J1-5]